MTPPPRRLLLRLAASLPLAALPLVALPRAGQAANLAATPLSRLDLPWWRQRFTAKQAELASSDAELLFLGDSITAQWETDGPAPWQHYRPVWQEFYGRRRAVNLGFTGDCTSHLLWRLQNGELEHVRPKAAVMLIGANNFGRLHWGAEMTIPGILACVAELRRRSPATRLLVLSVLPSDRGPWVAENMRLTNQALARDLAGDRLTSFLDVTRLFTRPDGQIDTERFRDRFLTPPDPALHPTAPAMGDLARFIEPSVARMLAS
jgi:hypothetical protein